MSACVPTRTSDSTRTKHVHPPHSPPPGPHRRFRVAGADVSAAIAVFLIALPLSLGIALATGAPLQAGLVAAAVGGIVAGRVGGSPLQVSGPAAGLTVVTADLIQRYGWRTTCAVTVLAGLAQLGLGCLRVARTALAVSPAIVHGMLAGIGVTIAVAQLHIVLGGTPQSSVLDNLRALPAQLAGLQPAAVAVSALTLTLLLLWPRIPGRAGQLLRKVPTALVAVAGATVTASLAGLTLPKVDLPSWRSHALPGLPEGPALGVAAAVLTITLVCSVQSLLGAVAVDKLIASRPGLISSPSARSPRVGRSDLDRELLGQGAANIVSGALGGLPVAGVAVRSSANVQAGAVSRNSTMLHGVLVVVAALLMVPILELIPLASLAALVMAVGIQMVSLHHIRTVTRHREVLVYAVTTLAVVFLGVLEGVMLGIAVAVAVALNRLTRTRITHDEQEGVHHVHVRGQLTFLAVPRLSRALHLVPQGTPVVLELDGSFMDHAAYEALQDWQKTHTAQGGTVELTGRRLSTGATTQPQSDAYAYTDAGVDAGRAEATAAPAPDSPPTAGTPFADCRCRPWTPWRNHQCEAPRSAPFSDTSPGGSPGERPDGEPGALAAGHTAEPSAGLTEPAAAERADGPTGATGPTEPTGANGTAGAARVTGADGQARPTGAGGHTQATGADGQAGTAGSDGPGPNGSRRPDAASTRPASTDPATTHPAPTGAGPADPAPAGPDPTDTTPAGPDPTDTTPAGPDPTAPVPAGPGSDSAASTHPGPTGRGPTDTTSAHPTTTGPNSTKSTTTAPGSTAPGDTISRDPNGTPPSGTTLGGTIPDRPIPGGTAPGATNHHTLEPSSHQLVRGISAFQRNTAPLVRGELARLAREGQQPTQLFLTCADSRLVTSMITSSGPGDLFVVRNVGNLVPPPGEESGDDSVGAAIEYAVDVLKVRSITVCGHSGCGAMQALLSSEPGGEQTPLKRWLRHGLPSLERMADDRLPWARLAGRASADAVEQLCLTNVVQQLDHLRAHDSVARALGAGELELHGLYFHVGEAQTYLLTERSGGELFDHVGVAHLTV